MERVGRSAGRLFAGLFLVAGCALPQAYTISAKPGALNYVEGVAYLDGNRISDKALRSTFLGPNDTLATDTGKAEVLLSPGVFLRIGDNTQIRMIEPSLVNTKLEVTRGEAMIEVAGLVKDNTVQVVVNGGSVTLDKNGLYRFNAGDPARVAVLDGKALVNFAGREVNLGKGKEAVLNDTFKTEKFDTKQPDELYAWSNIRAEYNAAASYQAASAVNANSFGGWGPYGFSGWSSPGWYWASGFDSWAWLPMSGAFYSPFGYGFYSPGAVGYAPVVITPVYGSGTWTRGQRAGNGNGGDSHHGPWNGHWVGHHGLTAAVPVNPQNPAAVGTMSLSPSANRTARIWAAQSFANEGFHTANNAPGAVARTGGNWSGANHSGNWSGANHSGNWSGANHSGNWSGANHGGNGSGASRGGNWSGGGASAGGSRSGGWSGGGGNASSAGSTHVGGGQTSSGRR